MRRDSLIGQTVADRFRVLSRLGEGGTGQVYLAEHNLLERQFAIKVLRRDMISDATAVERFRREARAASRMQHRNIVYISDFGQLADGRLFLVMEYIPGDELSTVVAREERLPPERAARILLQIAEALDYAHDQGVVHRDLKAENIILTTERRRVDVAKVLDFGLAKILHGAGNLDTITFKGEIYGTPEYIPPEQIVGDEVDHRADIYSLGVLTFEMLTGRTPFTGTLMELLVAHRKLTPPMPSAVCPRAGIPDCFDRLVRRAMRKRPEDRFERAADVAELLRGYLRSLRGARGMGRELDSDLELLSTTALEQVEQDITPAVAALPAHQGVETQPGGWHRASETPLSSGGPMGPERHEAQLQLRRLLHRLVRALDDEDLAPEALREGLDRAQRLEEQEAEAEASLAMLLSRLDELEASGRERESQLRYAIIDLGMERSRLESEMESSSASSSVLDDLAYQIGELEVRLLDGARRRESQLDELDTRITEGRRELDSLRSGLLRSDRELASEVSTLRPAVTGRPDVAAIYSELDPLMALLGL